MLPWFDVALLFAPLLFSLAVLYSQSVPWPVPLSQVTFLTGTVNVSLFWLLFRPSTHSRLFQAPVKDSADSVFFFFFLQAAVKCVHSLGKGSAYSL